jgi:NTP pyrophosphatase (non-canonical NTP hydrolase)
VSEELADVLIYLVRLASRLEIDLEQAAWEKLEINKQKYPVEKSRGIAKKYTEL